VGDTGYSDPCNSTAYGGAGGIGTASTISGTSVIYAAGGGGASERNGSQAAGGSSIGGNGGSTSGSAGTAGAISTGSGGGGRNGTGASGIVIIRYSDSKAAAVTATGSPTYTIAGGYRTYTFTTAGSLTF
jgi:hypothetical protein